jgi:restriction endonuclease
MLGSVQSSRSNIVQKMQHNIKMHGMDSPRNSRINIEEKKSEQHKTAWDSLSQKNRIQYLQQKVQIMRTARRSAACGKNDYLKLPNP